MLDHTFSYDVFFSGNIGKEAFPRHAPAGKECNIGIEGKIYHLPFDQQYDSTIIEGKDEFMALTVAEAEKAGFRRAYRWHGT